MKRKKYTEHFEQFWRGLDRSFPLGNKVQAYNEFIKLECNQEDVNFLINSYNAQVAAKNRTMKQGIWEAQPKHINRWLKLEEFDNEICERFDTAISKDDKRAAEYQKFLQNDVGEDMGGLGSSEAGDRTDNVLNFPLLDVADDGH